MYRRLPHGPHGMGREAVGRHQRTRLYGAMIEAVHQRGYQATTVAHVIALAGVSRRAFYEHFASKEECFLGTYDISVARSKKKVLDAWDTERGWANRMHKSCQAYVEDTTRNVKASRLVLVEALGIGAKARERLLLAANAYERVVTAGFKLAPDGVPLVPLGSKAIVGGCRYVAFSRVCTGREAELPGLTDELLDWISAYRSPAIARLSASGGSSPCYVPPSPARFLEHDDKRTRTLGAVVHLTLDEGYRELTDPQIAQFAGMSTEAFHKQFPNKQECFLAAIDAFAAETLEVVEEAAARASSWPESVYLAMRAAIEHFVARPGLIRMAFVDLFDIGPALVDRLAVSLEGFAKQLRESSPEPRRGPALTSEAVTGAVWAIIGSYAVRNRLKYLPCLTDYLAFIVLAPYVGPKLAAETIENTRKQLASGD
jgi:AcrR family transcriptional regulator